MTLPQTPSFHLAGKRALITGASSGIGRACAVALAEYGAAVTLAARRADQLEETAAHLRGLGQTADVLVLDVGDVEATKDAVARHGPFDILINSAGTARHSKPLTQRPKISTQ